MPGSQAEKKAMLPHKLLPGRGMEAMKAIKPNIEHTTPFLTLMQQSPDVTHEYKEK